MRSKIALFFAALLFFNIILPTKVFAASVQDQSKPIFGLTADQVVEKYNQLTDQQKDQVLRSLGNTSIFANSLFGNIFNSTFGALDDAVKKLGDLFFQANGVIYKLGSSALAWVSRLIDKVFNNDLNDLNISQPVIDDFYFNTRLLNYLQAPLFSNKHLPSYISSLSQRFNDALSSFPDDSGLCFLSTYGNSWQYFLVSYTHSSLDTLSTYRLIVDDDQKQIYVGQYSLVDLGNGLYRPNRYSDYGLSSSSTYPCTCRGSVGPSYCDSSLAIYSSSATSWVNGKTYGDNPYLKYKSTPLYTYTGNYENALRYYLDQYLCVCDEYIFIQNNYAQYVPINHQSELIDITNNTYYNYIYNIPVQTPLNTFNIVSNTAINYDPVENLIQYLPDNYNIEQNFSVVNNYYISSGSAISGQAIDVNIVSPGVIDVRVINPEDLTQQVTNNISKDIINNTDVNFGDLDFSPSVTVGLNAAKDSIEGIVPVTGSSIVAQFVSGIPPDWLALGFVFLILFIVSGFGMSIIRH